MIKEMIISLVILAGSIILYGTLGWLEDPRAATFPRIILIIMGILAVALLIQSLLMKGRKEKAGLQQTSVVAKNRSAGSPFPLATVATCFLLIIAYFAVMQWLGFYFSAFLFFSVSTIILGRKDLTVRKAAFRVMSAFIFVAILYVLFKVILVVQTPKGLFV